MSLRKFLRPNGKKILLTVIPILFFGFLATCFPLGWYSSPDVEGVLIKRPYCRIIRGESILGRMMKIIFEPFLLVVLGLAYLIFFVSMYLMALLVLRSVKEIQMPSFPVYFGFFCAILYLLFVCYLISCLIFWIYEKRKEKMKKKEV